MNKEVIMIFENNDKENKQLDFPFDMIYRNKDLQKQYSRSGQVTK